MNIDQNSAIPLYAQLEQVIEQAIAAGELRGGAQLPTEDELIATYGVSRTTVRTAVQKLIGRGLIEVRRGRGTFVSQPRIVQDLTQLRGFVEDMESLGLQASTRLLGSRVVVADERTALHLDLPVGSEVVRIERVRLADAVPVTFDVTFLPVEIGEQVLSHDLDIEPIFPLLEEKFGLPLKEAECRLEATLADREVARILEVEVGSPVFLIERTSIDRSDRRIDYERLHYRGDLISFVMRLARDTTPRR